MMVEFTAHDKKVADLYKKAVIKRQQEAEAFETRSIEEAQADLDKQFWGFLPARLTNLFNGVIELEKNGISKGVIDKMKQDGSDLMNMVAMYSMPEVINQLINEAETKRLKAKMLKKVQSE